MIPRHITALAPREWVEEYRLVPYAASGGWIVCYGSRDRDWKNLLHKAEAGIAKRIELTTVSEEEINGMLRIYYGIGE